MQRIMITMLIGCLAIAASIGFKPAAVMAQSATPDVDADREAIEHLVRRYYEIANSGELGMLSEVLASDFTIQNARPDEDAGLDGVILSLERSRASRPDLKFHIDDLIVDGNAVVVRTTITGTHLGNYFGVAPTGERIEIPAIDLWHVEDGKLVAVWHLEDLLDTMEQVGLNPRGEATVAAADTSAPPQPATAETSAGVPGETAIPVSSEAASATPDAATVAANLALAHRFRDVIFEAGKLDVADEILAADFTWHAADVAPGVDGVKAYATKTREAFPDLTLTTDHVLMEGDTVAILWTLRGTHQGEFLGAAASGNSVSTSGIDVYRMANGQIAEIWTVGDDLGLLFQLGVTPEFMNGAAATPAA